MITADRVTDAQNTPIKVDELPEKPAPVSLDDMADDLANLRIVDSMIATWEATRKEIRERIAARLGEDGEGTLNGRPVFAYGPTAKFAGKKFTEDYPEIAEQFTAAKVQQVLDTEQLRRALPDLYRKYQVRSLRPIGTKS